MATINQVPLVCIGNISGGTSIARAYPEAASQTFVQGEAVYLDGNGRVAEYTTAIDDATQRFLGFAAEDGHNNATAGGSSCLVDLAGGGNLFEANVTNAGAAQITAITQPGLLRPLYLDAGNARVQVDIGDTADNGDWVRILELSKKDAVGDTYGRVVFTIVPAGIQVLGT